MSMLVSSPYLISPQFLIINPVRCKWEDESSSELPGWLGEPPGRWVITTPVWLVSRPTTPDTTPDTTSTLPQVRVREEYLSQHFKINDSNSNPVLARCQDWSSPLPALPCCVLLTLGVVWCVSQLSWGGGGRGEGDYTETKYGVVAVRRCALTTQLGTGMSRSQVRYSCSYRCKYR